MRGQHGSLEGDLAAVFAAAGGAGSDQVTDDLLAELAAAERANWRLGVRLYPDVVPTLGRLRRAGARLAIVTNASAEAAGVIPALGLDGLVDAVLASCDAGSVKPDLLVLAMRELGVTRPKPSSSTTSRHRSRPRRASGWRRSSSVASRRGDPWRRTPPARLSGT